MKRQASFLDEAAFRNHYLSNEQLHYFFRVLSDWREHLQRDYAESRLRIRSQEETGGDLIDQCTKDIVKTMEILQRNRKKDLLGLIDTALQRIADGSYGYCRVTDEEIGYERLRAYPIATLSIETQELLERRSYRQFES